MGIKRQFGSDGAATILLAVLNGEQETLEKAYAAGQPSFSVAELEQSTQRVSRLASCLLRLQEACDPNAKPRLDDRQIDRLRSEANKLLLPYVSVPTISIQGRACRHLAGERREKGLSMSSHLIGLDQPVRLSGETESRRIPRSEATAVAKLQHLVSQGRLMHLRACVAPTAPSFRGRIDSSIRCARWFLAPRVDRHWCSKACYCRLYGTEPNYKKELPLLREQHFRADSSV